MKKKKTQEKRGKNAREIEAKMQTRVLSRRSFMGRFLEHSGAIALGSVLGNPIRNKAAAEERPLLDAEPLDQEIVRYAIHPGIGVARIGNSQASGKEGYWIGPEVIDPPLFGEKFRDEKGAIRRQAARFHIYGYNVSGQVVREVTARDGKMEWHVYLANKKGQWYRFLAALDLPEAKNMVVPRRNPEVLGEDRRSLVIDSGPRSISGIDKSGDAYAFDTGKFKDSSVLLGELRTDEEGRLLVLGGQGKSGSPNNKPVYYPDNIDTFNNADDWYDDISDGPVKATLTIADKRWEVESAWVIVAPPNYAPNIVGFRTLYDLLTDTYTKNNWIPIPETTSFSKDILPVLQRLTRLQWVNQGFAEVFGRGSPLDFEDSSLVVQLADKDNAKLRKRIYELFRTPESKDSKNRRLWPMIYGDAFGSFPESSENDLIVSDLVSLHLKRWMEGDFVSDWHPETKIYREISEVPIADQPATLDKAALHFCLADAFHPGCELTWPMRHLTLYRAPFRIKAERKNWEDLTSNSRGVRLDDYGPELTRAVVMQEKGALFEQGPGDLTRWMAVPWQGDTVFCRSGYEPEFDPYLPTFWPARVPNHILTLEDYKIVIDERLPLETRLQAFRRRPSWVRVIEGNEVQQIHQMIAQFGELGIVTALPGVEGDSRFPSILFVELISENPRMRIMNMAGVLAGNSNGKSLRPMRGFKQIKNAP